MKNIRRNVFETNSSSSHSISISTKDNLFDDLEQDENGVITLNGGEFGWGYDKYHDALTKANYCAVDSYDQPEEREMLISVIKEHTGCRDVVLNINKDFNSKDFNSGTWSYIDHQSQGTSEHAFQSRESLKRFIFGPSSYLVIDNDNH